jgi:hypothetical protein
VKGTLRSLQPDEAESEGPHQPVEREADNPPCSRPATSGLDPQDFQMRFTDIGETLTEICVNR